MTTSVLVADAPVPRTHRAGECRRTTPASLGSAPFLYGLSLAVALPPAAWLPPPRLAPPTIHPTPGTILDPAGLRKALGRPIAEIGRGRIALGDVDRRLHGLGLTLDVLRAGDLRGALVAIGVVAPDRLALDGEATLAELWTLARAAIPRHGRMLGCELNAAADPIVVHYGGATSQVAWLAADHLATVSVTDLDGDEEGRTELAHAVARLLAHRLAT